jgi:Fic family protein
MNGKITNIFSFKQIISRNLHQSCFPIQTLFILLWRISHTLSKVYPRCSHTQKSQEDDPIKPFSDPIKERLYQAVLWDGTLNYAEYAAIVGTSEATVKRRLGELKKEGAIIRVGSNKTGHWEINKEK